MGSKDRLLLVLQEIRDQLHEHNERMKALERVAAKTYDELSTVRTRLIEADNRRGREIAALEKKRRIHEERLIKLELAKGNAR